MVACAGVVEAIGEPDKRPFNPRQVDDDPVERPLIVRVDHGPLNTLRALFDGRLGQSHENGLGRGGWRDVDFDVHRDRLNSQPRERMQFGQHGMALLLARVSCSASRCTVPASPLPRKPPTRGLRGGGDTHMSLWNLSTHPAWPARARSLYDTSL